MADENRSRRLQRFIVVSSALGILVVGMIVGVASVGPLHGHLKKVQESHLMWVLVTKKSALEEILSRTLETAKKIAASPEVAKALNDHINAEIGAEGQKRSTQTVFSTMMSYVPAFRAISILDEKGNPVAQFPASASSLPESPGKPIFFGSTTSVTLDYLAVAVPIHDNAGEKIGTTVVSFRISDLERVVRDRTGLGSTGETVFGTVENDRVVLILQSRDNRRPTSQSLPNKSPFTLAIQRSVGKETGILIPGRDHHGTEVIAYSPVAAGQWGITVKMDKGELYAPVLPHIITAAGIISVLVLMGTLGTLLLVHPLTGKMVIHAEELNQQVREKVKVIEDLYEQIVQSEKSRVLAEHTAEVAHELRQPLAIVGGFAHRMAKHFDSGGTVGAEQKESCRVILSEVQRLERILDGLIDFTRRSTLELERTNPDEIIGKVLRVYEPKLSEKSLEVESALGAGVEPFCLDSHRFEQVVRNLVSNAIEASLPGQVITIQTGISLPGREILGSARFASNRYFEMKIKNRGAMIPREDLRKIFSPFYTTKQSGKGLGLTLSRKIVEDHEGSISAISDTEGTVFIVWLPVEHEQLERDCRNIQDKSQED